MANQAQLKIIKQGVMTWNKWRRENPSEEIMLDETDLIRVNLSEVNLKDAYLADSILSESKLVRAILAGANLGAAKLVGADLSGAYLGGAYLGVTDLTDANLKNVRFERAYIRLADFTNTNLVEAKFEMANLELVVAIGANFRGADLRRVYINESYFENADFTYAVMGGTTIAKTDLSVANSLDLVRHDSPSTLGTDTLIRSRGKIPETFLRGCGLSDWEIEAAKLYDPNITNQEMDEILYQVHDIRAHQPVQISPLFISYSHDDGGFVDRMEKSLNEKGIRFWRDIHRATAGKLEKLVDRAIRQNPTVLVILSENSIESDWVQHEVRLARKLEQDTGRDVLCPVRLDDSFFSSKWPERIKEQVMEYNILDFSEWEDDEKFEKMFTRLIDGLNLFYKKEDE